MASNAYVIDTHALLWYLDGSPRLGQNAKRLMDDPNERFWLPAIALSEALFVLERKPERYNLTESGLFEYLHADPRIMIVDLDEKTIAKTLACKAISEMHDRQIVATALLAQIDDVQVAILTRDENIRDAGLVPTIW